MALKLNEKKAAQRVVADPAITSNDFSLALKQFFNLKGTRDLWSFVSPLDEISWKIHSIEPHSYKELLPLMGMYADICATGAIPKLKHQLAIQTLNNENMPGMGMLKVNFTTMSEASFIDKVDDKLRMLFAHLRHIASSDVNAHRSLKKCKTPEDADELKDVLLKFGTFKQDSDSTQPQQQQQSQQPNYMALLQTPESWLKVATWFGL